MYIYEYKLYTVFLTPPPPRQMVCQMYCSPTACYFQFHLATSRWQLRNLRKCSVTWIWRQTASPNIFWKMVPFWLDIMMISTLQRFLISKTHPEISVDERIQLSNFRKSWMSASASNFLENDWQLLDGCFITATWDHSPQHGTKMTLEPRCDVQMVGSSRCVFFPWHLWPRIMVEMSAEDHGRNCLERLEKIMVCGWFFFPCFVDAATIGKLMFGLFFLEKKRWVAQDEFVDLLLWSMWGKVGFGLMSRVFTVQKKKKTGNSW